MLTSHICDNLFDQHSRHCNMLATWFDTNINTASSEAKK